MRSSAPSAPCRTGGLPDDWHLRRFGAQSPLFRGRRAALHWNLDPVLIDLGLIELRWYGLFFAIGLLIAVQMLSRSFADRGLPEKHAASLSLWLPIGMIVGAHLIHLVFYEPRSFIENPKRILEIGSGLASHGGGLGVVLALWLFCQRHGVNFHRYLDATIVAAVWLFPWVRVGNFFNSEIYGRVTDAPWGIVFEQRGFTEPRHPSQLYEALLGVCIIALAVWLHKKRFVLRAGITLYTLLFVYFSARTALEVFKEYQILSSSFPFTMGQLLSVPVVVLCVVMILLIQIGQVSTPRTSAEPVVTPPHGAPVRRKPPGRGRARKGKKKGRR